MMPRALLFDMDGTLTQPFLDYPAIRAQIGVRDGCGLLEHIATLSADARVDAETILHAHEERAASESLLNPGCDEVIAWVREHQMPTALITRNRRASVACVLQRHGLNFD